MEENVNIDDEEEEKISFSNSNFDKLNSDTKKEPKDHNNTKKKVTKKIIKKKVISKKNFIKFGAKRKK